MATLPTQVQAGDVISSELMNAILSELARLGSSVGPGGTQVVPNVFGAFLGDARATILNPARQLTMGFTFDVSGTAIDPAAAANFNLIVLNQSPLADSRVAPATPVNLVVSRAGTAPSPTPPPTITGTETATGTVTSSFPVNGTMVIVGTNFSATASQNAVTFDNTPAASVMVDPADPTRRLIVVVPTGIPGAPVNTGDPSKSGVVVRVATGSGAPATTTITVTAPVAGQPTITSVSPSPQLERSNITIAGTNFASTAQVLIRDVAAVIVSRTTTQIVATVPDFADIFPGSVITSSVTVSVPGVGDATFSGIFRVRGA